MKRISFSRKTILRAIHAACVAFALAAGLSNARAQTAFGNGTFANPYTNNVSTASTYSNALTITLTDSSGSGAYYAGLSLLPAGSNTTTNSGPIQATVNSSISEAKAFGVSFNSSTGGSLTFQNSGAAISGVATNAVFSGTEAIGLVATTGSGSISITNQGAGGTISGMGTSSQYSPSTAIGVQATTTSGAITVNNLSGATISGVGTGTNSGYNGGNGLGTGVSASTTSGTITITNGSGSNISGSGSESAYGFLSQNALGDGINLTGSNSFITNNGGTISGTGNSQGTGILATASGINVANTGQVTITNTGGTIESTGSASGAYANAASSGINVAGTGQVTITNAGGTIEGTGSASGLNGSIAVTGINVASTGQVAITNTAGTIEGTGSASGAYSNSLTGVNVSSSSSLTITNSALISGNSPSGAATTSGIDGVSSGALTIDNQVGGTVSATGHGGLIQGISATDTAGSIQIANAGSVTASGDTNGIAINVGASGSSPVTFTNTGSVMATTLGGTASGIYVGASGSGPVNITNSSSVTITTGGTAFGIHVNNTGTGDVSVTNGAGDSITATPGATYGFGIDVSNSAGTTVENSGSITGPGGVDLNSTTGIIAFTNTSTGQIVAGGLGITVQTGGGGTATVTNNGSVTSSSNYDIGVATDSGAISVTNTGTVNTGTGSLSYGIASNTNSGSETILNEGTITGTGSIYGINANSGSNSAPTIVTNTGTITGSSYAIGARLTGTAPLTVSNSGIIANANTGIYAYTSAAASSFNIRNTGTITASNYGIYTLSPATVYNTGSIHATTAISVPSGSFVTLAGNSDITGTISGGPDSASTSQLTFALSIPPAELAAAQTQLAAEIAAYAAQMGGNYTFDIDGRIFDISNFLYAGGITDDLIAQIVAMQRLYANVPGYQSLGTVLDNLNANNAQASNILSALGNVSDANLPAALAELSPKELQIFRNVAFDNNTFNATQINNHLANLRDGLTGFDSSALTVQDSGMDPSLNQVRSHLLAYNSSPSSLGPISDSIEPMFGATDMKDMKSTKVDTMPTERWSSFIAGNVILADLSNNTNLQNSNYTTGSVTAGVDYRLDEHFTVGALFAYAHTDASLDSRGSSATVDSYSPGLYASYVDGGWYGNAMATYNRNSYTDDRNIDIAGIAGDNHGGTSGNQGDLNLTGGYEFHKGAFKFGPVASAEYVHLQINSMQEQGPAALTINDQNQDSFRSLLGFEGRFDANISTPMGPVSLTPHASASWQHEYLDNSNGINAQFTGTGGGSFVTQTDSPDRDSAFFDVGLDAKVSQNVTVFVDYEAQAGQQNFFAQSAQGGVKIGF